MAEQTTMFRAVDYMAALCKTAAPTDAYVYDGPQTGDAGERIVIQLAYSDNEGGPAIDGSSRTNEMGWATENYDISCAISIDDGDTDLDVKRTEVRAIYNSLVGAVRADRTLGGLIIPPGYAELAGFVYTQDQFGQEGSAVIAAFTVAVREAWVR